MDKTCTTTKFGDENKDGTNFHCSNENNIMKFTPTLFVTIHNSYHELHFKFVTSG